MMPLTIKKGIDSSKKDTYNINIDFLVRAGIQSLAEIWKISANAGGSTFYISTLYLKNQAPKSFDFDCF